MLLILRSAHALRCLRARTHTGMAWCAAARSTHLAAHHFAWKRLQAVEDIRERCIVALVVYYTLAAHQHGFSKCLHAEGEDRRTRA